MVNRRYTAISVLPDTKVLLSNLGKHGDTYDSIIKRLAKLERAR